MGDVTNNLPASISAPYVDFHPTYSGVSTGVSIVNDNNTDMSSRINEIAAALSKAQGELDTTKKDSKGYGYNYSDLASVIATARPILAKHNLSVVQLVGSTDEFVEVTTILSHSSGQFFRSVATLPVIEMKGCNVAQGAGASLSYLRRYAYQAILGMASEDNDANSNGGSKGSSRVAASSADQLTETKSEGKKTSFRRKVKAKPAKAEDDDI